MFCADNIFILEKGKILVNGDFQRLKLIGYLKVY